VRVPRDLVREDADPALDEPGGAVWMTARASACDESRPACDSFEIVAPPSRESLERGRDRVQPVYAGSALTRALVDQVPRDARRLDHPTCGRRQREDCARTERSADRAQLRFDERKPQRGRRVHPGAEVAAE